MNSSDEKLVTALRGVAATLPQSASAELGTKLQAEFHRYHARRRRIRRIQVGSAALCLSVIIVLLVGMHPRRPAEIRANMSAQPPSAAAVTTAAAATPKTATAKIRPVAAKSTKKAPNTDDFMMLPSYDPAPVGDDLRIVRVELTGDSLRRLGAPVAEELSDQRMKADVVVGTDGTPYAVRLVNAH